MNFVRVSDAQFDLDTISWVTPRLAVTDMNGAQTVFGEEEFFVINTAREIDVPCNYKLAIAPFRDSKEEVRSALNTLAELIHEQIETTPNKVVVHCFAGMERSVLTVVWYLHRYRKLSIDDAYQTVTKVRPVALDRREWAIQ